MRTLRTIAMLGLFLAAAMIEAVRLRSLSAITNGDLWWHLSSGLWILQAHALPRYGIYSQAGASAWVPVNWAYDVLLAALYRVMDLRALPALLMCLKAGLAAMTFLLAGGLRGRFWTAAILSAIGQYVLGGMPPSPAYLSVIFFAIELLLIFEGRERPAVLYWLAPLFLVWANFDNQFVYGIGVIVLFVGTTAAQSAFPALKRWATVGRSSGAWSASSMTAMATGLAVFASLITPSFHRPYATFIASVAGPAKAYLPDFKAMSFHQPQDYLLLLLTMTAFLALGRRQSRDLFQIVLLSLAAMLSFYAQRNLWIIVLVDIAIIADAIAAIDIVPARSTPSGLRSGEPHAVRARSWLIPTALTACAIILMMFGVLPRQRNVLLAKVAEGYPVHAGDYIREHRLPQPLFNAYEWGGFLTWYLPQYPVAIDSRRELYGDEFIILYSKAMNADVPYTAFPAMVRARTLVFPKTSVLGEALSTVAGFKLAYSDDVGIVLTREEDAVATK